MRTSTSFAALVALMAVAGSAAPIGARTFPAPAPVPDNHSATLTILQTPSKDSGSIITIPNPLCGNCHDDTVKNVPDHSKSAEDTIKNVKDGAKGPAPDAHDIVAEVKADLGKVVGDGGIVSLGQKPKQDADCDDLLKVGGKPVVSSSLLRRFSSRILPQGWVA
ncbi:hypothetical protein FRC09_002279 [Ceratobasidium sp. 395]|nr:hypothetical protein FRC09_002279 [Ceratobasidium sp. 395]